MKATKLFLFVALASFFDSTLGKSEGQLHSSSTPHEYGSLPFVFGLVVSAYGKGERVSDTKAAGERHQRALELRIANNENEGKASMPAIGHLSSNHSRSFNTESESQNHPKAEGLTPDGSVAEVNSQVITHQEGPIIPIACATDTVLQLKLEEGKIRSSYHKIASIDANHQLQFDDTVPEIEPVENTGWSVTSGGELAIHGANLFYQCHSGESYKLYDAPVHSRCLPVVLEVVELASCN